MKKMWSPWRSKHIESLTQPLAEDYGRPESATRRDSAGAAAGSWGPDSPDAGQSLFVRLAQSRNDIENLIVWRGDLVYVVMNRYPYNNGHLLVVPYRQVQDYDNLTTEEQVEMALTVDRCIRWLRKALNPDGFNVGMNMGEAAGAGIPEHLHIHVIPRWSGDTNFMPTVADVKVIPEAMEDTYAKLRAAKGEGEGSPRP